jgi:L-cysteine S-thiosulfotransferase
MKQRGALVFSSAPSSVLNLIPSLILSLVLSLSLTAPSMAQALDPAAVQRGFRVIADQRLGNCMACHSVPDAQGNKQGIQSTFAPPLDGVAKRYNPTTLRQWVADARAINPQTMMPPFAANGILSAAQLDDVLAALQSLR